jgi:hypothetical protein
LLNIKKKNSLTINGSFIELHSRYNQNFPGRRKMINNKITSFFS